MTTREAQIAALKKDWAENPRWATLSVVTRLKT